MDFRSIAFMVPLDQGPSLLQPENSPRSEHVLRPQMGTPPDQHPHPVAQAANLHTILDSPCSSTTSWHPLPVCQKLIISTPRCT